MIYPKKHKPRFIVLLRPGAKDPEIPLSQRPIIAELCSEKAEDAIAEAKECKLHGHVFRFVADV
jgi:hypothetical protein